MDLKMSGSGEADRDRLGCVGNEVKGCVGALDIVPELAEFQNVYETKNPSTMRVEGVGQRIYFPEENMDMWREVLLCYDVNESVVDAEMYAGQVTIEFEERWDSRVVKRSGQLDYFEDNNYMAGSLGVVVDTVVGLDTVLKKGAFQARSVMASKALLLFLAAQAVAMGLDVRSNTAVQLKSMTIPTIWQQAAASPAHPRGTLWNSSLSHWHSYGSLNMTCLLLIK